MKNTKIIISIPQERYLRITYRPGAIPLLVGVLIKILRI
jgi:hypothetical protein